MPTDKDLYEMISSDLACEHLEVHGPDCVHFEALVVSEKFAGKSLVQRHQLVYATLGNKMDGEIHALSLKTLTPDEWRANNG